MAYKTQIKGKKITGKSGKIVGYEVAGTIWTPKQFKTLAAMGKLIASSPYLTKSKRDWLIRELFSRKR